MDNYYIHIDAPTPPTVTMTATWTGEPVCPQCGGYYTYPVCWWGLLPPMLCTCRYRSVWTIDTAPINTKRKAWKCPRCHAINAPHVNQCTCKDATP